MIPIKRLGKMRINNRKNLEYCSLFECPRCGSRVIRPNAMKSGYIGKHRLVLEKKLGRFLKSDEVAHHVNENKLDNRSENIELMSFSEHSRLHAKEKVRKHGRFVTI